MATNNSLASEEICIYSDIYCNLYSDIADLVNIPYKESRRDIEEIRYRLAYEGLSFLTKVLPSLGKALDKALHSDSPISVPTTFGRDKGRLTPKLFRWLYRQVFSSDGSVAPEVDVTHIRALRQLTAFCYKLDVPHKPEQEESLLNEFVDVDKDLVRDLDVPLDIQKTAALIVSDIFQDFDHTDIMPQHGRGSVATGEQVHEKHVFKRLYTGIERVYSFTEWYSFSLMSVCDTYHQYEGSLAGLESGIAKVILVPKDSRGPRIISCEPLEYQWIQQGLGRGIMSHLESNWLTKGRINFRSQLINQNLALLGSKDQTVVTLDMKEASDRVSVWLVDALFEHQPNLRAALQATRSTHTRLPSGRVMQLNKFAPMGSCLCFPVEAVCFFALGVASIMHSKQFRAKFPEKGTRELSYKTALVKALDHVWVYGDDIVVSREFYPCLSQCYPSFKLKLNEDKCCVHGFFRESCGVDAFKGINVTPLRLKRRWCHRTVDANCYESWVEFSNSAYARGFKRVASFAASLVEGKLGQLPVVKQKCDALAFVRPVSVSQPPPNARRRFQISSRCDQSSLQRLEWSVWAIRPVPIQVGADSWGMVLRTMSNKRNVPRLTIEELRFTSKRQGEILSAQSVCDTSSPSDHTIPGVYSVTRRSRLIRVWSSLA